MKSLFVKEHRNCRLCGSKHIEFVLDIGNQYVNNFVKEGDWEGIFCPLQIYHCKNCDLYQLKHTAPQELLYKGTYWYKSGVTDFMVSHLRDLAKEISLTIESRKNKRVLDIGANDGTLLKYIDKDIYRVGVEPATNLQKDLINNCDLAVKELWTRSLAKELILKTDKFDVITAIGMFYDLDDPIDFLTGVWEALKDDGIFVAQLMCMDNMLKTNDLGNICHEHIEFYSLKSLEYLFRSSKLCIDKIETNNVNGQSYRIYASKKTSKEFELPYEIFNQINNEKIDINSFKKNIEYSKNKVTKFIKSKSLEGKVTAAFGASTKGNAILQYFELTSEDIPFAVDRAPWKENLYTIGSWIPIKFEEDPTRFQADYYLVLPWGFIDEFILREEKFLDAGGKFIVPFPVPRIIDKSGETLL